MNQKNTYEKSVTQKKNDFCFLDKFKIPNNFFLCDMDSTIGLKRDVR